MITEQLKSLVRQEADNIKKYATTVELSELDFEFLYPTKPHLCIYGQMTGECRSPRALELLAVCSNPYSKSLDRVEDVKEYYQKYGSTHPKPFEYEPFSPIEFYIAQQGAKNENLIAYLKGKTDNLEL